LSVTSPRRRLRIYSKGFSEPLRGSSGFSTKQSGKFVDKFRQMQKAAPERRFSLQKIEV
jgi:hypothetical protein